jgi:DNA polymerase III delta prime subunit
LSNTELLNSVERITEIIGHQTERLHLTNFSQKRIFPPSMIFYGIKGIGKALIAKDFILSLMCTYNGSGCRKCQGCITYLYGNNPDFYQVDCEDEKWKTNDVRGLLQSLSLNAYGNRLRIVLIDHAEFLSVASANAMLKVVEEPGKGLIFIIVTSMFERIPLTLRSRCQLVKFNELTSTEIRKAIVEQVPDDTLLEVVNLAGGSIGTALALIEMPEVILSVKSFTEIIVNNDVVNGLKVAKELSKSELNVELFLQVLGNALREKMVKEPNLEQSKKIARLLMNIAEAFYLAVDRKLPLEQVMLSLVCLKEANKELLI